MIIYYLVNNIYLIITLFDKMVLDNALSDGAR